MEKGDYALDLICGKQVATPFGDGSSAVRHEVFPKNLQAALRDFTEGGGSIMVSGSYIGTDVWDRVYPIGIDSLKRSESIDFIQEVLGFKAMTNYATSGNELWPMKNESLDLGAKLGKMEFWKEINGKIYNVENPDGLLPASEKSHTFLRYTDTNISAATCFDSEGYRTACLGFPLEVLKRQEDINALVEEILSYFERQP